MMLSQTRPQNRSTSTSDTAADQADVGTARYSMPDLLSQLDQISIAEHAASTSSASDVVDFSKLRHDIQTLTRPDVNGVMRSPICSETLGTKQLQTIKDAPLFCPGMLLKACKRHKMHADQILEPLTQFGHLGRHVIATRPGQEVMRHHLDDTNWDLMVLANMNIPWSAFICGSQGAGKSHTLSCLLESGLLQSSNIGSLPKPLAAMVFHYDNYTRGLCGQVCEAAYLCSSGIPVTVLVSPSNIWAMTELYNNLPGLPGDSPRPKVLPLYLAESSLDITTMLKLMAIDPSSGDVPLYMEIVMNILREMAMEGKGSGAFSYAEFRSRLDDVQWTPNQRVPLDLRLQLLDCCLEPSEFTKSTRPARAAESIWSFPPGSLTIVDLSDPFIGSNDACSLFAICLSLFMDDRAQGGRVVALDEAHKFLTQTGAARTLTADLTSVIRQQRHTGTRVLIATQEPTLAPELIDLCNATFVHRFLSPAWYEILKKHLAGVNRYDTTRSKGSTELTLFDQIIGLDTGEALLFCPTAVLGSSVSTPQGADEVISLGSKYVKIRIRNRLTTDGGQSIRATDTTRKELSSTMIPDIPMHIVSKPPSTNQSKPVSNSKAQQAPGKATSTDTKPIANPQPQQQKLKQKRMSIFENNPQTKVDTRASTGQAE